MTTEIFNTIVEESAEVWYRYRDQYHSNFDEDGEPTGTGYMKVYLDKYYVKNHTPCGVRFTNGHWISKTAHRRFACPILDEAKISFIARKEKQRVIYLGKAERAKQAINIIRTGRAFA